MPTSVLNWKTPYELLMNKPVTFDHLKVFGSLCYPAHKTTDEFAPRAKKCIFLGYPYAQKGYKLYDLDQHKIILSRDVIFKEHIFPYKQQHTSTFTSQQPELIFSSSDISDDTPVFQHIPPINSPLTSSFSSPQSTNPSSTYVFDQSNNFIASPDCCSSSSPLIPAPRKSSRIPTFPSKNQDFVTNIPIIKPLTTPQDIPSPSSLSFNVHTEPSLQNMSSVDLDSLSSMLYVYEPNSYNKAKNDPRWISAMNKELEALENNHTWELTTLPPDKTAIGCKWVYKIKFQPNGSVERCKARLVARGDKQVKGKDYKHTFSPVARFHHNENNYCLSCC